MRQLPDGAFQLIYLDPPFNTGRVQERRTVRLVRHDPEREEEDAPPAEEGAGVVSREATRTGFAGRSYAHTLQLVRQFDDRFADYWGFLEPRLVEAWRLLDPAGTLYVHLDYREAHYAKVVMDALVGRERFLNEIVWAYDYGAKPRSRWPAKHDTILVYVKRPGAHFFDADAVEREPYMAPGLVTAQQRERGKMPTDVWWHTIVSPTGAEKTGYPAQKPEGVLRRIVQASSRPGDWIADFFGGSGTTAAVARALGRRFVTADSSPEAIAVMRERLGERGISYLEQRAGGPRDP